MNISQFAQATGATADNAKVYFSEVVSAMERFKITTKRTVAAFLATVSIESSKLTAVEEDLYYKDPVRLALIFPRVFGPGKEDPAKFVRNPSGMSKLLYGGFHGRGLIQLSWQKNYARAGAALGFDYVADPKLLLTAKHAALTAGWYWFDAGCNEPAEAGDMTGVTRKVNGPSCLHLDLRTAQYEKNLEILA